MVRSLLLNSIFLILLFPLVSFAQDNMPSLVILPFDSRGIDDQSVQTAEYLLRMEIEKLGKVDIISSRRTIDIIKTIECNEDDCAFEIGEKLNASQVLNLQLNVLGEKIIVLYFLADVASKKKILIDQVNAQNVEELETVMKRIASSIVNLKSINSNVEVGSVLQEESKQPFERTARKNFGVSFGYLYPQKEYDNDEKTFVFDLHFDYELPDYAVGMLLGIRHGFAMNLYGSYLFTRTDVCPYIGGAFGFHWVTHNRREIYFTDNQYINDAEKDSDGFELTVNGGVRILHTYSFQIIVNLEYIYTMNGYNDQALVFTIGLL